MYQPSLRTCVRRAAAVELAEEADILSKLRDISYSEQYDIIFDGEVDAKKVRGLLLGVSSAQVKKPLDSNFSHNKY